MNNILKENRKKIDKIDKIIAKAIYQRFALTKKISAYKKKKKIPIYDKKRETEILKNLQKILNKKNNNYIKYINQIYKLIFKLSKQNQK